MNAGRLAVAIFAALAGLVSGDVGAQAPRPAGGLVFHYGLVPSEMVLVHPQASVERQMHPGDSRKGRSHLVLALFDEQSGARISDAEVMTHVTLVGGASTTKPLEPMNINDLPSFGAYVPVGAPGIYKIRFEVKRPGVEGTVSAEFEHRVAEPRRKGRNR